MDEHWLHYGASPAKLIQVVKEGVTKSVSKPPQDVINLAVKLQELPPHRRYLVEELVEQLQQDVG